MNNRITPEKITYIDDNHVVVIGTNESGKHGVGAARLAYEMWGALAGHGFGPMGNCFGIPTKDWNIKTLPLNVIEHYVKRFIDYAKKHPETQFLVTKIGCGYAGYSPNDIAMMFADCIDLENVSLPQAFIDVITKNTENILEPTLVNLDKIPSLQNEDIKEKYDIKEGTCPPKIGECPLMFYNIQPNHKIYCPSCNRFVTGREVNI